jgi:hypothetical protein
MEARRVNVHEGSENGARRKVYGKDGWVNGLVAKASPDREIIT